MLYAIDKIVRDVRVALDHNASDGELEEMGDVDTLSLNEIIRSKILDGVRSVHMQAPYWLLEQGHNLESEPYWDGRGGGWLLLPDDFMRLVVFEMSDWERALHQAMTVDDPRYAQQKSRHKGLRGSPQKPMCAIDVRPEGRVLEFWSCKSEDAWVSRGVYMPEPRLAGARVDISGKCYRAAVYAIAAHVLTAYGDADKAQMMDALMKEALDGGASVDAG